MDQNGIENIKKRMAELEILINKTKNRLPAHSTKPPVMMDLLEYEDEYDMLFKKLNELKSDQ
ncbi:MULTISPECIES: hypothetical protein [Desulfobacula]|uniref:Uncharacterized protein n=1 Tax=Desulfobacula phenolica TaxID=90732 RepID=A0A1H2FCR1_9BACT|nr:MULTISPECIES: hypothetical protein [Desulfobacula]SDU04768.1 hypothetical protein SAMN04487931_10469 [Desulfobacula phenolica]